MTKFNVKLEGFDDFSKQLEKFKEETISKIKSDLEEKTKTLYCNVCNKGAQIVKTNTGFEVVPCCDNMQKQIDALVKQV